MVSEQGISDSWSLRDFVLILVVVEIGLGEYNRCLSSRYVFVLILVVVEIGLGGFDYCFHYGRLLS